MAAPHTRAADAASAVPGGPLDGHDDALAADGHPRYCPLDLLASFTLLMAGHGRCVHTAMMLGDREYALWHLACARAMGDAELDAVAKRLLADFDDPAHSAWPMLGTA